MERPKRGLSAFDDIERLDQLFARNRPPVSARKIPFPGRRSVGSAEFGSNLSRRLQSDGAPLLGPEHRQVGQALDAEPARKPTLHRGFKQLLDRRPLRQGRPRSGRQTPDLTGQPNAASRRRRHHPAARARSSPSQVRMAIELWLAKPSPDLLAEIKRNLTESDELVDEILLAAASITAVRRARPAPWSISPLLLRRRRRASSRASRALQRAASRSKLKVKPRCFAG